MGSQILPQLNFAQMPWARWLSIAIDMVTDRFWFRHRRVVSLRHKLPGWLFLDIVEKLELQQYQKPQIRCNLLLASWEDSIDNLRAHIADAHRVSRRGWLHEGGQYNRHGGFRNNDYNDYSDDDDHDYSDEMLGYSSSEQDDVIKLMDDDVVLHHLTLSQWRLALEAMNLCKQDIIHRAQIHRGESMIHDEQQFMVMTVQENITVINRNIARICGIRNNQKHKAPWLRRNQ